MGRVPRRPLAVSYLVCSNPSFYCFTLHFLDVHACLCFLSNVCCQMVYVHPDYSLPTTLRAIVIIAVHHFPVPIVIDTKQYTILVTFYIIELELGHREIEAAGSLSNNLILKPPPSLPQLSCPVRTRSHGIPSKQRRSAPLSATLAYQSRGLFAKGRG